MVEKELQEKLFTYRILEARLDGLVKQRDMLLNKIVEIRQTIEGIDEMEKSKNEILFPIGSEAYVAGKASDKKNLIVEIGANVALKKNVEDAKEILKKRINEINSTINELQKEIIKTSGTLQQLGPEIEFLVEKSKAG